MNIRQESIKWWNSLSETEKLNLSKKYNMILDTGIQIESIYLTECFQIAEKKPI